MSAQDLLIRLQERGIRLEVRGEKLHYTAPKGTMDAALRRAIREHRFDLLAMLRASLTTPTATSISPEEIASFKALKVAVQMRAPWCSEFWLVPERTGQDRLELTVDDAITLVRLLDAFPGSVIEGFRRPMPAALPPSRADWPEEWKDSWEERAAIMEFDGHLARNEAEQKAEECVREQYARRVEAEGAETPG